MSIAVILSGDLPSREFEAGHINAGSHFPCPCGAAVADYSDSWLVLSSPPLADIKERMKLFGKKDPDFAYDVRKMKVIGFLVKLLPASIFEHKCKHTSALYLKMRYNFSFLPTV